MAKLCDPTAGEMRAFLTTQLCGEPFAEHEFEVEEAIYWFANDYHGGGGSNLYSALSMSEYHPGPLTDGPGDTYLYELLEQEYANG